MESNLAKGALPIEMTVGGRTYEILGFLQGEETFVGGDTMVDRAKEMQAYLGEFDGRHILDHQKEIHPDLWDGNVLFIFPDWRNIVFYDGVSCVHPGLNQWVQEFLWVGRDWYGYARLLRLKSVQTAEVV